MKTEHKPRVGHLPPPTMMSKAGEGLRTAGVVWIVGLVLTLGVSEFLKTLTADRETSFIPSWTGAIPSEVVVVSIFDAITLLLVFAMCLPLLYSAQTSPRWRLPWMAGLTFVRGAWVWFIYQLELNGPSLAILAAQMVPFVLGLGRMLTTNNTDILGLPRGTPVTTPGWRKFGQTLGARLRSADFTRLSLTCLVILSCAPSLVYSMVWLAHSLTGYNHWGYYQEPPTLTDILMFPLLYLLPNWPLALAPVLFRKTRLKPENRKTAAFMLMGMACALALPMALLSIASIEDVFSTAPDAGQGTGIVTGILMILAPFVAGIGALIGYVAARLT
jgi:hypothetical protein